VDRTGDADSRTLTFDFGIATAPERCMKIKQGQDVMWSGPSNLHPLIPFNGDTPTPIPAGPTKTDITVNFPDTGTFGYKCQNHATMQGAIMVVP
jgi:plastocyanin